MKKFLSLLVLPVCLLVCACTQNADNSTNLPPTPATGTDLTSTGTELSAEKELEIRQAFFEKHSSNPDCTLDSIEITSFYGAYNGAYVLFIDAAGFMYATAIEYDRIEDTVFMYASSHKITVYRDGAFYKLPQAYEEGLLTLEDVHSVSEQCRAESSYYSSYIIPKLSSEKELEIRQAFFEKFKSDSRDKLENVQIEGFWGAYNGAYAVYFGCGILDVISEITVDDIVFSFPSGGAYAYVYKDGEFYSFNEAYDSGLLTLDDFRAVHRLYEQTMRETTGWKI